MKIVATLPELVGVIGLKKINEQGNTVSRKGFGRPLSPAIVKDAQNGKSKALKLFYLHFADAVLRLCSGMLGSVEEGRDLTQDVFIKAFTGLPDLSEPLAVGGWLKQLSVRLTLDHLKQRERQQLSVYTEIGSITDDHWGSAIETLTQLDDIERIMHILSASERLLVWLYAVEGYSHQELAELLDMPEQNSRQKYRRALIKLATQLQRSAL